MDLRDTIRSTGAVRHFTDEPVDSATVHAILDDARFAPSGGNRQPWRVAVINSRLVRRELGTLCQPVWDEYTAMRLAGRAPFNVIEPPVVDGPLEHAANPLLEGIEQIPVVLAVAVDLSLVAMMDSHLHRPPITGGASVYPFCWNLLLAARARGLGGVITTFASHVEPVSGPLLGLPDGHALAAVIFLGHPVQQPTRLRRQPVESFATVDRFDGAVFTT